MAGNTASFTINVLVPIGIQIKKNKHDQTDLCLYISCIQLYITVNGLPTLFIKIN